MAGSGDSTGDLKPRPLNFVKQVATHKHHQAEEKPTDREMPTTEQPARAQETELRNINQYKRLAIVACVPEAISSDDGTTLSTGHSTSSSPVQPPRPLFHRETEPPQTDIVIQPLSPVHAHPHTQKPLLNELPLRDASLAPPTETVNLNTRRGHVALFNPLGQNPPRQADTTKKPPSPLAAFHGLLSKVPELLQNLSVPVFAEHFTESPGRILYVANSLLGQSPTTPYVRPPYPRRPADKPSQPLNPSEVPSNFSWAKADDKELMAARFSINTNSPPAAAAANKSTPPPPYPRTVPSPETAYLAAGSVKNFPQSIFPHPSNNLPPWSEAPHHFTHLPTPTFHWTRHDAQQNWTWNIHAHPPCLNCQLADLEVGPDAVTNSRHCDRWAVQHRSSGQVRSCSQCTRTGQTDRCIETIEIRRDGRVGYDVAHTLAGAAGAAAENVTVSEMKYWESRIFRDWRRKCMWSSAEVEERKTGQVWWRGINLSAGNVWGKRDVVDEWCRLIGGSVPQLRELGWELSTDESGGWSWNAHDDADRVDVGGADREEEVEERKKGELGKRRKSETKDDRRETKGDKETKDVKSDTKDDESETKDDKSAIQGDKSETQEAASEAQQNNPELQKQIQYWQDRLRDTMSSEHMAGDPSTSSEPQRKILDGVATVINLKDALTREGWGREQIWQRCADAVGPEVAVELYQCVPDMWL